MKRSILLIAALAALSAQAQVPFDTVVQAVVGGNPELAAARRGIAAQSLDDADANALADPSVDFARVWGRHGIGNKLQLDVSQSFDWPGVYSARSEAAGVRRSVGEMQLQVRTLEIESAVRDLLVELVYVRHQIGVIDELADNFASLSSAIDRGVRGGELTVIDQRKMQIESFEIDGSLTAARTREQQIISELQGMTDAQLDLAAITEYPVLPLLDLQEYIDRVASEPQVLAAALESGLADAEARVASRSRMPGFSVGYQHQAEMGDRFNGFTVGLNLPVFAGRRARGAALERRDAADIARDGIVMQRTSQIRGLYDEALRQRERLHTYQSVFGDHQYLSLLLRAYEGGQISVIDYLSEVHYYHQAILTHLDTEYAYHRALSTLNYSSPLNK